MKRFFFSLIALSAVAAGCTQSALLETPDFGGTEISFSPYTGRTPVTRAASVENAAGLANASATAAANADPNGFYVYGFLNQINGETKTTSVYLDNKKVYSPSKGANANDWTYEGLVYWPDSQSESTLDFVAYSANGVGKGLSSITKDGFTFTVDNNVANQVDLLATRYYAGNTYDNTTNGTTKGQLSLQFHHLLSRVGFKVQSTTDKTVTITALTFTGDMPTQGTLDFDAAVGNGAIPELQPTAASTPVYNCMTGTAAAVTSGRVPGTEYLMIMPHIAGAEYDNINTDELKGSDHKVNVTYTIQGSDQVRTSTVTLPIGFEFAAGKAYEIVLKISTSSLSFDVQEEDWNSKNNDANINPNEPPVPEEEEDDNQPNESIQTQISNNDLELTLEYVSYDVASFLLKVNSNTYKDEGDRTTEAFGQTTSRVYIDDKRVGISYRKKNSTSWTTEILDGSVDASKDTKYTIRIPVEPKTEYEYRIYSVIYQNCDAKKSWGMYTGEVEYKNPNEKYSESLAFITRSEIMYPSFTLNDLRDNAYTQESDNQFSVKINGYYDLGEIDGETIRIKEYGFCWTMGTAAPTLMDDTKKWEPDSESLDDKYDIEYTIPNLKPNTTYSFCAYAILKADRSAYVCTETEQVIPSLTKIFFADQIIYSSVQTFTTGVIVNSSDRTDDNEDGSWGSSNQ